ncbi:hypothetical protein ACIBKY_08385 [Nonomuraea sp. NPDC050394]|uniref:hypothetical protein n=1 Tax=Nonomuraea sp. NPDC050394 TaxID=3364363 RepID=UPI00378A836D
MRRTSAVTLVMLLAGLLTLPSPARAAATGRALTGTELAQISPLRHHDTLGARDDVAARFPVVKATLNDLLAPGGHTARPLCHGAAWNNGTNLRPDLAYTGYCWDATDTTTAHWYPQGMTGSGDAMNGSVNYPPCPGCPGKKITAVSWRNGTFPANAVPRWQANQLARVTFTGFSGAAAENYRHALLVEPDGSAEGFREINSHADGLTWYGNKLFLFAGGDPAGRVIRVFDLTQFWRMNSTSSGNVGCVSGVCSAAWSSFALPQIGYYQFRDAGGCAGVTGPRPCFSGVSLDRSGADSLITVEHVQAASGRVVRWPLDFVTARLEEGADGLVRPREAWFSPVWDMQGGVFHNDVGVMEGLCPNGYPAVSYMPHVTVDGVSQSIVNTGGTQYRKSCLHQVIISADRSRITTSYLTTAPGNAQNLSFWPASNELWLVNEYRGDTTGSYGSNRQVLSLKCVNLVC